MTSETCSCVHPAAALLRDASDVRGALGRPQGRSSEEVQLWECRLLEGGGVQVARQPRPSGPRQHQQLLADFTFRSQQQQRAQFFQGFKARGPPSCLGSFRAEQSGLVGLGQAPPQTRS